MQKITLAKPYKYSPDGLTVIELAPGEHELSDTWAQRAIEGGYTNKAKTNIPHNKAVKPAHNKKRQ